jgi:hypothetical protein
MGGPRAAASERPAPSWAPARRTERLKEAARGAQVELVAQMELVAQAAVELAAVELAAVEAEERRRAGRRRQLRLRRRLRGQLRGRLRGQLRRRLRRAIAPRHHEPSGAAAWPARTRAVESRAPDEGSHRRSSVRHSEAISSYSSCGTESTLACRASGNQRQSHAIRGNQRSSVR